MPDSKAAKVIRSICLFISRPNIKGVLRQIIKEHGTTELTAPDTMEDCITLLKARSDMTLVLDWEHGPNVANRILGEAQSPDGTSMREIYLITSDIKNEVIVSAAEYNVSRVHVGDITKNTILLDLQYIAWRIATQTPLKSCLLDVVINRKAGNHLAAAERLRESLNNDPDNIRLALELADSLTQVQVWDEAERLAEGVLSRDPSNLRALHLLARCKMKRGAFIEAIKSFELAASMNRLKLDRLVEFGQALMQTGRHQDAMRQFDLALEVNSNYGPALRGKGQCHMLIGEVNDGLEILRETANGHELAAIFNATAIMSIKQSKFETGISLYKTALGVIGKNPAIAARLHFNLGLAHYKDNHLNEALSCFIASFNADSSFISAAINARVLASLTGIQLPANMSKIGKQTSPTRRDAEEFVNEFHDHLQEERKLT